jgi:hypothetical protein
VLVKNQTETILPTTAKQQAAPLPPPQGSISSTPPPPRLLLFKFYRQFPDLVMTPFFFFDCCDSLFVCLKESWGKRMKRPQWKSTV